MAKTYKGLYPQVYSFENLYNSWRAARKGKRERVAVASFEFDLEGNLLTLERELREQTYRPGRYTNFYIYDPKQRLVSAAPFQDRVVHHALCNVLEPIWESRFIATNYACRVGKGTHKALDQAHRWVKQYGYAFHGDVVKYFPSIDLEILHGLLAKKIGDKQVMSLIACILQSGAGISHTESPQVCFAGDDLLALLRPRGLPIGNLTSQLWANIYLHELDQYVKQKLGCAAYLRYMDDFVLFTDDKKELHAWREAIRDFLARSLRLVLHPKKSVVAPTKVGLEFCGFRLYSTHRRLRRSSIRRFVQRFRHQRAAYQASQLTLADWQISLQSWLAHANHGDTWRLRSRIFADYPLKRVNQTL